MDSMITTIDIDAVRERLDWKRMGVDGTLENAQVISGSPVLKVTASFGNKFFCAAFVVPAFFSLLGALALLSIREWALFGILFTIAVVFGLFGACFLWRLRPLKLDKSSGVYYRGFRVADGRTRARQGPLSDILAIQVLSADIKYTRTNSNGDETTYDGVIHEINFVCRDGTRINALSYKEADENERAADQFAAFLDVPVWHRDDSIRRRG